MLKLFTYGICLVSLIACQPAPKPINFGEDMCHYCKMTIVDKQHAAEAVTSKGKAFKFDAIECMVNFLSEHDGSEFAHLLVCDYANPGELITAQSSTFVISKAIPSPMGAFLSAFKTGPEAENTVAQKGGEIYSWNTLKQKIGSQKILDH